ncbi:MAG: TonB-dependent receptor, partial [Gammaproteobacteria bacterium]|nr:TonB-dependent receptor [Gammaproteobacteria bacterium]
WLENRSVRLSFNGEWRLTPTLTLNMGDMVEKSDFVATTHSPRLALNYQLTADHYLRVARSRAYRNPSFVENFINFSYLVLGRGDLRPERIDLIEVAVGGKLLAQRLDYELRLFEEKITDFIDLPDFENNDYPDYDNEVEIFINQGEADLRGVELTLKWQPSKRSRADLSVAYVDSSGYAAEEFACSGGGIGCFTGDEPLQIVEKISVEEHVPLRTVNLLLSQQLGQRFTLSANVSDVSAMNYHAGDDTGGYQTLDLTARYRLPGVTDRGTIQLTGRNLLQEYYDFEEETVSKKGWYLQYEARF